MKLGLLGACVASAALVVGVGATVIAAPGGARGVGVGAAADGAAGRPMRMLMSGQFGRLLTLRSELQLTDAQREQIKQILQSHRDEIRSAAKPVAEKRRAMRDAALAETPDESAIRTAADELGKAIGDAAVLGAKIKGEVRGVLTSEQRDKVEEFRTQADAAVDAFFESVASAA
jgi:protein CpxP